MNPARRSGNQMEERSVREEKADFHHREHRGTEKTGEKPGDCEARKRRPFGWVGCAEMGETEVGLNLATTGSPRTQRFHREDGSRRENDGNLEEKPSRAKSSRHAKNSEVRSTDEGGRFLTQRRKDAKAQSTYSDGRDRSGRICSPMNNRSRPPALSPVEGSDESN